jgi:hypothetical protein
MSRAGLEAEREDSGTPGVHPSLADLERFMRCELEAAEHQAIVRHLMAGCEKCRSITARLWNPGGRETISLIEMLASPKTLARHRRRARSKKWDPRMSAAVASLESVAREILKECVTELEGIRDRLEALAAGLSRVPVEDPEKVSPGEALQTTISCVLQDSLRPAIGDLSAAADSTAEPDDDEEAETA